MGTEATYETGKNRFLWGLVLAWAPVIPLIIGIIIGISNTLGGLSEQKATSLGAVAGGLAEAYFFFGLAATFAFQVGGIVLLIRSPSNGKAFHAFLSFASIAWSIFMLILLGFSLWLNFVYLRRH